MFFRFGSTPLHQAAYFGHFDCAAVLLAAGALANVEEAWGQTPLFLAAQRAHRFVVIVIVNIIILFYTGTFGSQKVDWTYSPELKEKDPPPSLPLKAKCAFSAIIEIKVGGGGGSNFSWTN